MRLAIFASCVWNFFQRSTPLCDHLARLGVEVVFIEPMVYPGAEAQHLAPKTVVPLPAGVRVVCRPTRVKRGLFLAAWQNAMNALEVWRRRPDVVVLNGAEFCAGPAIMARLLGVRVVLDYIDDWPEWSQVRWERWALRRVLIPLTARLANVTVVTAKLLGDDIRAHARRLCWIPNGAYDPPQPIDNAALRAGEGVVFVGGLAERIDVEWIVDLARHLPEATVTVLGGGPQYPRVEAATRDLANLVAPGPVSHAAAMDAIRRAAVCLIPYKVNRLTDRCFPIKLAEYWSFGRAVIATTSHETRRVGRGIVQFASTGEEAARQARILIADPERRSRLGEAGLARAKVYNYSVLARRFLRVCSGRNRVGPRRVSQIIDRF